MCEREGIPAAVVVTAVFENLGRTAARAQGYPTLRLLALPHPMESRPEAQVRALARHPEQFLIAVAGGESGHHALYFCTFGLTWSVSKRFTLDAEWSGGEACDLPGR